MDFDQTYNGGPVDWNFPSPNATPTHNSFGTSFLQTPKTATFPTHFQDAFRTPQFPSYATPQQPQHPSMTPVQRPQTASDTLRSNHYANIHTVGSQANGRHMPPPGQHDSSAHTVSPMYGDTYSGQMQVPLNQYIDSSQMQTPPPTRGTSAKRIQQAQQIAFGTPSTIASRRYLTPQQPIVPSSDAGSQMQQTPVQFPQLQFSPELYQFAHIGPASAPVMPQSRVFWDHTASPLQPIPQTTLADPFAPNLPSTSANTPWDQVEPPQLLSQNVSFDTPAMNSFALQPTQRPAPSRSMSASYEMQSGSMSTGVDPSLLYSSPIRPVVRSNSRSSSAQSHSTAEEKQKKNSAVQAHSRSETSSSAETITNRSGANLQRSNTTVIARPKSAIASSLNGNESLSRSNSINTILRTSSPVKRFGRPSLGSISEGKPRQRTSVILTVDENGIARTETKKVDGSPTRSIRERYPALFDSDSSDAETDSSERTPSRPSSFIFDKRDERRSKAARLDPPVENLEGLSIPRSGSAASMRKGIPPSRAAVAAAAQLRRQGSLRRSTPSRNMRRIPTPNSSSTSLIDTCPMDLPTERQAKQASAQSFQNGDAPWYPENDTFGLPPSSAEGALDVYNRRWSMMSFEQQQPQHQQSRPQMLSPQHPQHHHVLQPAFSATNGESTQRQPQLQIRCVCGIPNNAGHPLIQCSSCTQWLHASCVGVNAHLPPSTYTCFLCTPPARSVSASASQRPLHSSVR